MPEEFIPLRYPYTMIAYVLLVTPTARLIAYANMR